MSEESEQNGSKPHAAAPPANIGATPTPPPPAKKYFASLRVPGERPTELHPEFAEAVRALEGLLNMPVWFLIQDGSEHDMCRDVEMMFFKARHDLPQGTPVALLLESPGGQAAVAYSIAKMLQRHCGEFTVIVANWAKSAATLLSLGASEIIMAEHAQLGPLDVQIDDPNREEQTSALDETQAFERLHAASMVAVDQTMGLLARRTRKKVDALLPHTMRFVADLMRPMLENVDVVQYTNRSRLLKVAEQYAVRLLRPRYPERLAHEMARHLVENYPEHGFIIDYDEARDIGLHVKEPTKEQAVHLDTILLHIEDMNAFGRVVDA